MNQLSLFLPCAAGVENFLAEEVQRITGTLPKAWRAGVQLPGSWRDALLLNLHSRLAQRVLVELAHNAYRSERDLYNAAFGIAWEAWFTPRQSFKVEITAQHSPLQSLNFAALTIKDAIADRFRERFQGVRPDVDTRWPDVRIYAHLTVDTVTVSIDTSGEPLFKRGWREDTGDAPLKETLAAAMLAASGWTALCRNAAATPATTPQAGQETDAESSSGQKATEAEAAMAAELPVVPALYDPFCGSGTIAIEAAQIACNIAAGSGRRFAFEKYLPHQPHVWDGLLSQAQAAVTAPMADVYGSDVAFRMVDFANRNAERAGVAHAVQFRGGDALQRLAPAASGVMLVNPPYGERIEVAGVAGAAAGASTAAARSDSRSRSHHRPQGRENLLSAEGDIFAARSSGDNPRNPNDPNNPNPLDGDREFFAQLASHWKKNYTGWTAHILTPDFKLPSKMRLKESRRVPLWNGPIECRLFRFDMVAGSARRGTEGG